jgi:formate transporter
MDPTVSGAPAPAPVPPAPVEMRAASPPAAGAQLNGDVRRAATLPGAGAGSTSKPARRRTGRKGATATPGSASGPPHTDVHSASSEVLPVSLSTPPPPHIALHMNGTGKARSSPALETETVPLAGSGLLLSGARHVVVVPSFSSEMLRARQSGERKPFHQKMYKTPKEAALALETICVYKASMRTDRLALLSFVAGVMVAFGGLFALSVAGGWPTAPKGLQKLVLGACFQVALSFIVIFGGDLFTGDTMTFAVGLLVRAVSWRDAARVLTVSYLGNFAGAVFGAAFFGYWTELYETTPWLEYVTGLAVVKCGYPVQVALLKGIACNWLVCLGVWMALCAESVEGKILASALPITAFAATGFEHCIANMFYVPLGLMYGAPTTFGIFLYRNLLLVTLGNVIGGAGFMGIIIWWVYMEGRRVPTPQE